MSKIAVAKINNSQYLVEQDKEYEIVRFKGNPGDKITINEVLLIIDGEKITIGKPYIEKASVVFEILSQSDIGKVRTFTYKAKSRYRKTKGMRVLSTKIKINKIN